jgi:hypothetical protein
MAVCAVVGLCGLGAILFTVGCPSPPPQDPIGARPLATGEPPWVMLRVDTVGVSTLRPGTQLPWDPAPEPNDGVECGLLGLNAAPNQPVTGKGAEVLCQFESRPPAQRRDPSAPDLVVLLAGEGGATYQTYTAWDTIGHTFGAEFVIPVGVIPPEGLLLIVRDRDGARYEDIGVRRLIREQLVRAALSTSSPQIAFGEARGGLQRLDVSVYTHPPAETSAPGGMDARAGMIAAPIRPIRAGEVVEIMAGGQYRTGMYQHPWVGPNGYPAESPLGFNFAIEPFQLSPHAAAIALVGHGDSRAGMVVGQCVRFVSTVGGPVVMGLNDAEPRDNQGQLSFGVRIVNPTPDEWWYGQTGPCQSR